MRAKADADAWGITPAPEAENVSLWTDAKAERLLTDPSGKRVTGVEVTRGGERVRVTAGTVLLSAGAVNSAALLLASRTDRHPPGWATARGWSAATTWPTSPR